MYVTKRAPSTNYKHIFLFCNLLRVRNYYLPDTNKIKPYIDMTKIGVCLCRHTPKRVVICKSIEDYKFGFIFVHSATGGTMPSSTISSRILQRCS